MTKAEAKAAIDQAFCDSIAKMFGVLKDGLRSQPTGHAQRDFHHGFELSLRAHSVATAVAEELIKD